MSDEKLKGLLGLAQRAGKISSGAFAVEQSIRAKKVKLILIASDASESTAKKFSEAAIKNGLPLRTVSNKESLGQAIGKESRAAVAVLEAGFAGAVLSVIDNV